MIPELLVDIDTADAVPEAIAKFGEFIHFTARRISRRNSTLAEDLVQEAAIRLWQLDPARFDADDAPYLEREIERHMSRAAQRERAGLGGRKRMWVKGL